MIKTENNNQVTFRHLVIPTQNGNINGFALWYKSEKDAKAGFKKFHEYISASGETDRSFSIGFEKNSNNTYSLKITIAVDTNIYNTDISGITSEYVEKITAGLAEFQFYFITAGYDDENGEPKMLPISDYNYFRQIIYVDNKTVIGTNKNRWPYEIFESKHVELIKDDKK